MIKDQYDIINRMLFLNQFQGLSVLESKRELYNHFEDLFDDGGTMEYYGNYYENQLINSFFNGNKISLGGF